MNKLKFYMAALLVALLTVGCDDTEDQSAAQYKTYVYQITDSTGANNNIFVYTVYHDSRLDYYNMISWGDTSCTVADSFAAVTDFVDYSNDKGIVLTFTGSVELELLDENYDVYYETETSQYTVEAFTAVTLYPGQYTGTLTIEKKDGEVYTASITVSTETKYLDPQ